MANHEHLRIIKEGVNAWNEWRRTTFRGEPNLSGADLPSAELNGANLSGSNLSGAVLLGTRLSGARLIGTNLREAYLTGANLIGARLRGASLIEARLSDADLSGADLSGADLTRADLTQTRLCRARLDRTNLTGANLTRIDFRGARLIATNLSRARIGQATFGNNDLSMVMGLETVVHTGPSTIGVDTLYRSNGRIPEVFLRGAGVPKDLITFIPSLVGRAIEFYSCFISYSHEDEEFSRRLHGRMQGENLLVWYAPEDMKGGRKLHEEIFNAIQIHDKLLLVLSEMSMKSEWVTTEIRRARKVERAENRRKLFPIRLVDFDSIKRWECFDADTGKDLAAELREYYIPDFSNWKEHDAFEAEFAKLLRDLKADQQ